jgi:hypothetical protein
MITSFLQYLLMAPSFTNIINVFVPSISLFSFLRK